MSVQRRIIETQARLVEVGRIRVGARKPASGAGRPLTMFRLTSRSRSLLEAAAEVFGGEVKPWPERNEYELLTQKPSIRAYLSLRPTPDGDYESLSQNYELWKGNTCVRRCTGLTCRTWKQTGTDKKNNPVHEPIEVPCLCEREAEQSCKLTSRLSVILPEVPAIGMWRLDTGSKTFDGEVNALIDTAKMLGLPPLLGVLLSIEMREKRTGPDQPTSKFPVVRIEFDPEPVSPALMVAQIQQRALQSGVSLGELPAPEPTPMLPAPAEGPKYPGSGEFLKSIGMSAEDMTEMRDYCEVHGLEWGYYALQARDQGVTDAKGFFRMLYTDNDPAPEEEATETP